MRMTDTVYLYNYDLCTLLVRFVSSRLDHKDGGDRQVIYIYIYIYIYLGVYNARMNE